MTTFLNDHKLWKIEASVCMKPLKEAIFLNRPKVKELTRFYRSEKLPLTTTSKTDHNKWNKRNLFLSG